MSQENLCIFLTGYKDQFKSKNSITKFKQYVKTTTNYVNELTSIGHTYLNENYKFKFVSHLDNGNITFEVYKTDSNEELRKKEELKLQKDILKYKLKAMGLARANKSVSEKKNDNLYLYSEYLKLSKMYKLPLPAPNVVLKEPHKYKKVIETALSVLVNQQSHPLYAYLKILSDKIQKMNVVVDNDDIPELVTSNDVPELVVNNLNNKNTTTELVEPSFDELSTEEEEDVDMPKPIISSEEK
jgi:hypothetical protein